ncbi:MAG: hypothetical protein QOC62_1266 [Mycobacterium sp.]|nr:hypothetical protein [Mycobacterium sp.]
MYDNGNCLFNKTTYEVGDDVVLRGADNVIVATDHPRKGPDSHSGPANVCDLTFQFDDVRPDDIAYQLTVDASRPIILSEQQLRDNGLEVIPEGPTPTSDPDLKLKIQG